MIRWLTGLREGSDAFGDLYRLYWALDFACSAEDTVPLPDRVCFPPVQKRLAAIVRGLLIDLILFRGEVHLIEDIGWAH